MHTRTRKLLQILVLSIIILSVFTLTLCFGDDNNGDKDNEKNGENGNHTNGNNTTNGNGPPPVEVIRFIELYHEPEQANIGAPITFFTKIESDYPLKEVQIEICTTQICFPADDMKESAPGTKEYSYDWTVPPDAKQGSEISYQIMVKDSLGNTIESSKLIIDVI